MFEGNQNWDLFGYDVRQLGGYWRSAWREFLWGYDSPIKARLDEIVKVHSEEGPGYYHAGEKAAEAESVSEAILLPDSQVLQKNIVVPLAVAGNLDAVMELEVLANSPFPGGDTGYGWKVTGRTETQLQITLAIVSLSSTMTYLGRQYDCHDTRAYEIWTRMNDSVICINGFGEQSRLARYNRRLVRVAGMLAYSILVVMLIFGLSAAVKYRELSQIREISADVQRQSKKASRARQSLVAANETVAAVNEIVAQYPSPHYELNKLSQLLGDDTYVLQVVMQGKGIRLRGRAVDAAAVMQHLTQESAYASVTAPQAISKVATTNLEQFYLNIQLADRGLE